MGRIPWDGVSPQRQTRLVENAEVPGESVGVDWSADGISLEKHQLGGHQGWELVQKPRGQRRGVWIPRRW